MSRTGKRFVKRNLFGGSLLLAVFFAAVNAQAETRLKLATLAPRGTSLHQSLLAMGQKWEQAPEGGVKLTIYTDGTMGNEADMVRRMRVGQLQAAMLTVNGLAEIDPSVSALQKMPLMFGSLDELDYVRAKLQPRLSERLLQKGFVVVFWADGGWVRFFTRQPALRPDDLKRMKIFVGPGDPQQVDIMKELGFSPVPLEWSDALTGLQTGMVDVVPTTPFYALAGQFYLTAKHMLDVNWAPLVGATVVTKKAWDALSPAQRDVLLRAAQETGVEITARVRAEGNEAVAAMKKRGLEVHTASAEVQEEWRKLAEHVYPRIRGPIVPAETFDEVRRLLAEYRAAHAGGSK